MPIKFYKGVGNYLHYYVILAMPFYALSTVLMQERLRSITAVKQIWLADDATGAGTIEGLKK